MSKTRILVADDEPDIREVLTEALTNEGYDVSAAVDGSKAIEMLDKHHYDLLLSDLKMPNATGIEVLKHIHDNNLPTIGIIATAYGSIDNAVEAMKLGAHEYITKPFHLGELKITIERALKYRKLEQENKTLKRQVRSEAQFDNIIGSSQKMRELFDLLRVVAADANSTVLVTGESGTGKELIARALHYNSPRGNAPLIPVNCGAIPEALLESELFGHVKGAFTGAHVDRVGRFKLADGGSIFLDEVGEMSPMLQVKLLRVLQEKEFEAVGSVITDKVNVRLIAATNQNLEELVEKKEFREDLYFRLNVIPMHLPPLRERIDDIPILLDHFLHFFNEQKGRAISGFTNEAIECLNHYYWRGNVRELENLVERMVTLNEDGALDVAQLPEKYRQGSTASFQYSPGLEFPEEGVEMNKLVEEFETHLIKQALGRCNGIKNRAAALLNIKRTTLVEKMKKRTAGDPSVFS